MCIHDINMSPGSSVAEKKISSHDCELQNKPRKSQGEANV